MMTQMRIGTSKASKIRVRKIISGESDSVTEVVLPKVHVKAHNLKYWATSMNIQSIDMSKESFSGLSWEEKELVLRTLFSKMNA
jgi:hypothetical protein